MKLRNIDSRIGSKKKSILLLALSWFLAGGTRSVVRRRRAWRELTDGLRDNKRENIRRAIASLYESGLVHYQEHADGTITLTLTKQGKTVALRYNLDQMQIPTPTHWDGKWRMVAFDIPEDQKNLRESLRERLKHLGFLEYQKSVFIHPYPCENEIEFIREFFSIKRYVRLGLIEMIDDDLALRDHFGVR